MKKWNDWITLLSVMEMAYLAVGNLVHLIFTYWVVGERITTGSLSAIEMGILFPMLWEVLCIPALLLGVVLLVLYRKYRTLRGLVVANTVMLPLLALQYVLMILSMFL